MMKPTTKVDDEGRVCCGCKVYKPWAEFNKATGGYLGKRSRCRICDGAVSAKWKEDTQYYQTHREEILQYKRDSYCPVAKKNYDLQKKYGITLDDFMGMYEHQNGCCKVCKQAVEKFSTSKQKQDAAVVDHCHVTGKVRGLLCQTCNRALGLLNDDLQLIRRLAEYLQINENK